MSNDHGKLVLRDLTAVYSLLIPSLSLDYLFYNSPFQTENWKMLATWTRCRVTPGRQLHILKKTKGQYRDTRGRPQTLLPRPSYQDTSLIQLELRGSHDNGIFVAHDQSRWYPTLESAYMLVSVICNQWGADGWPRSSCTLQSLLIIHGASNSDIWRTRCWPLLL